MKRNKNITVLGQVMKSRLRELGLTQLELADKIGTSNVYLNCIISGKRTGKKYLDKIFYELDMDMHMLCDYMSKIYVDQSDNIEEL